MDAPEAPAGGDFKQDDASGDTVGVEQRVVSEINEVAEPEPAAAAAASPLVDYFVVLGFQHDEDGGEPPPLMFPEKKKEDPKKKQRFHTMRIKDIENFRVKASVPYKGAELHRYPRVDNPNCPLPGHLWLFAFPTGVILEHYPPPPPRFFVNALTQSDGSRSYLVCIKFFEQTIFTRSDLKLTRQEMTLERNMLFAPKAICIMSSLPLFSFFKKYLGDMFMICQSPDRTWTIPMEGYIAQLTLPIPFTFNDTSAFRQLHRLVFTVGEGNVACALPNLRSDFSIADVSFRYLFQALDLQNFVVLLGAVLTEQKILVASRHYVLLISVMETVINLLSPFEWPHTYIPILPLNLLDFVDAPTPFIIGVHTDTLADLDMSRDLQDLVIIDCDSNTVRVPSFYIPFPADVSEQYTSAIGETLEKFGVSMKSKDFIEAEMEKIDLVFAMRAAEYESSTHDAEFTLELRVITTCMFVSLFGSYDKYQPAPDSEDRFDEESFLGAASDNHKDFVQEVMIRNLFEMFLSGGCHRSVFQLILRLYAEHQGDRGAIVGAVEALRGSMRMEESMVQEPAPHSTIISYTQFPELSYSNYPGGDELAPEPGTDNTGAIMHDRLRAMIAAKKITNEKELIILEYCFIVLSQLQEGNVNREQVNRMCDWLRGVAVAEGAPPRHRETKMNKYARKIDKYTKTLRKLGEKRGGKKAKKPNVEMNDPADEDAGENQSSSTEDGAGSFDDSLVSRTHLLNLLEMWCEADETEFGREPFGRIVKLLYNVIEECQERLPFYLPPDPSPQDNAWNVDPASRPAAPGDSGQALPATARGAGDEELFFSVESDDEEDKRKSRSAPQSPRDAGKVAQGGVERTTILPPAPAFIDFLGVIPGLSAKVATEYHLLRRLVNLSQKLHYRGEGALINHYAIEGFWEYFLCIEASEKYGDNLETAIQVQENLFAVVALVVNIMASLHIKLGVISSLVSKTKLSQDNKVTLGAIASRLHMERDAAKRLSEAGIEAPRLARTRHTNNMPRDSGATLRGLKNKWENRKEKKREISRKAERKSRSFSETDLMSLLPPGVDAAELVAGAELQAENQARQDSEEMERRLDETAKRNYVSFLGQGDVDATFKNPNGSSEDASSDSIIVVHDETTPRTPREALAGAPPPTIAVDEDLTALLLDVLGESEDEDQKSPRVDPNEYDVVRKRGLSSSSNVPALPPKLPPKTAANRGAKFPERRILSTSAPLAAADSDSPRLPPKPKIKLPMKGSKRASRGPSPTQKVSPEKQKEKINETREALLKAAKLQELQKQKEEQEMAAFLGEAVLAETIRAAAEVRAEPRAADESEEEAAAEAHLLDLLQNEQALAESDAKEPDAIVVQEEPAPQDEPAPQAAAPANDLPVRVDGVAVVEHPWAARDQDELELLVGDEIKLIKKHHSGWWLGSVNGRKGLFPVEYCRIVLMSEVI